MKATLMDNKKGDYILAGYFEKPENFYYNVTKKVMDIMFSIIFLIILFPIFLLVSVCIKVDSKGSVIFKQDRIGENGKKFVIYKFRTMGKNLPSQGKSPISNNDPRITKVGRVLRKTSIDELPQLLNIIKGEMSFIGPRPEQTSIVEKHYTEIEAKRFLVKPGITGLWQISPVRTKPIHENLQYDLNYIQNVTLALDLKILVSTIKVMIRSNTF